MKRVIKFTLNGEETECYVQDNLTMLDFLRKDLHLTGTKRGCEEGECGACTVLVEDEAVRSCVTPLRAADGKRVTTIEGLAQEGELQPIQQAFIDHGAFQCGYCTSGMLLTAQALLRRVSKPTRAQIVARMDPVLCRCGAHQRIVAAIEAVARNSAGSP